MGLDTKLLLAIAASLGSTAIHAAPADQSMASSGEIPEVVALAKYGPPLPYIIACAVQRHGLPVGANPIRQLSLQPEAIGAAVEVTKRLKPSV